MLSHSIVLYVYTVVYAAHILDVSTRYDVATAAATAESFERIRPNNNVHNKNALLWNTDVSMRLLYSFHWLSVQPITSLHVWHCHNRRHAIHHSVSVVRMPSIRRRTSPACCVHNNFKSLKQIFVRYLCVYWNCHQTETHTFHLRQGNWIDRVFRASQIFKQKKFNIFIGFFKEIKSRQTQRAVLLFHTQIDAFLFCQNAISSD